MKTVPPAKLALLYAIVGEPFVSDCFEQRFAGDKWRHWHFWDLVPLESVGARAHIPVGIHNLQFKETAHIKSGRFAGKAMPVTVFSNVEAALVASNMQKYFLSGVVGTFIKNHLGQDFSLQMSEVPSSYAEGTKLMNFLIPVRFKEQQFNWSAYLDWPSLLVPNKAAIHKRSTEALESFIQPSRIRYANCGTEEDLQFVQRYEAGAAWLSTPEFDNMVERLGEVPWKNRIWLA